MVYLLKMMIFHGKLLNNQMVSLHAEWIPWMALLDPVKGCLTQIQTEGRKRLV